MSRLMAMAFSIGVFAVCATAADAPKLDPPIPSDGYYPTKVGTTWVYVLRSKKDPNFPEIKRTFKIIKSTESGDKMTLTIGVMRGKNLTESATMEVTNKGVARTSLSGEVLKDRQVLIPYPFKMGDKWEWEMQSRFNDMRVIKHLHLKSLEKIEVPAGKYNALRIEEVPVSDNKPGNATKNTNAIVLANTLWYAHGIGQVKMENSNYVDELVEYTPGK